MTGPEHYRQAEQIIRNVTTAQGALIVGDDTRAVLDLAQVHATLALAAAQALHGADPSGIAWLEATT